MRARHPDEVPKEADWGHSNYKDIIRGGHTFREPLPLPYVTYPDVYGTWLFFQEHEDGRPWFCECQRQAMVSFLRMNQTTSTYRLYKGDSLLAHFLPRNTATRLPRVDSVEQLLQADCFRSGLCHRCTLRVPSVRWSNHSEHSVFLQHFGWYWKQLLYQYGIDWFSPLLRDQWPQEIAKLMDPDPWSIQSTLGEYQNQHGLSTYAFDSPPGILGSWRPGMNEMYELSRAMKRVRKTVECEIERRLRKHFGFPERGKTQNHETILFLIARALFAPSEVLRQARPQFLGGLTLDIFVPDQCVALEYQGQQHYEPFDHLGGERQFRRLKARDNRKKELCHKAGVRLVCFDVSDKMTEDYVLHKISQPDGTANGSQPIRSETNRTSSAADSRR